MNEEKELIWNKWNSGKYSHEVLTAINSPLSAQLCYKRSCNNIYIEILPLGEMPTGKIDEFDGPFTVQSVYKFNRAFSNANEMIESGKKAIEILVDDLYKKSEEKTKNNKTNLLYIRDEVHTSYNPITEELVSYETYYTGKDKYCLGR